MRSCDIVVVGGSAGALDVFRTLAGALPKDLNAAIFMVLHLAPDYPSRLKDILGRVTPLKVLQAHDREPIQHGHIYVAPPDQHLTIERDHMRVQRGPRENRHRPAIDPLFRTAARVYGARVTGIIMSGYLDDGAAGLLAVRSRGGYAIVQDPDDATASQMPESALRYAGADLILPAAEIGSALVARVNRCVEEEKMDESDARKSTQESAFANLHTTTPEDGEGKPSPFACPECHGVLWELKEGKMVRFRCRVGHAYSMENLHEEQSEAVESALWAAMRALEEKAALETRLSTSMSDRKISSRFKEQAEADQVHAETIRRLLLGNGSEPKPETDVHAMQH